MRETLPIREGALGFVVELGGQNCGRPSHSHDELELNLVTRGEGVYLVEDRRVRITTHTLLTLPPEREHRLLDTSADFRAWILVVRPMVPHSCMTRPERENVVLSPRDSRLLAEVCTELSAASLALLNSGLTFSLELIDKLNTQQSAIGPHVHPAVQSVARQLRWDPSLELSDLARSVGMSKGRLGRIFKSQMGVTLARYRNRIRLERARRRLREPCANALQIALECGFGSYAQFYRVLREETGLSPTAARRELMAPLP